MLWGRACCTHQALSRTIWWRRGWLCFHAIVKHGGVCPVQSNGIHDALEVADFVDNANNLLCDADAHQLMPWSHPIWSEPDFVSPFDAVLRAQSLMFSIFQEEFECVLGILSMPSDLPVECPRQLSCASQCPLLHTYQSCISHGSRKQACPNRHVHFHDRIDLLFGIDDEIAMHGISVPNDLLSHWQNKPWQLHNDDANAQTRAALAEVDHARPQCRLTDEHDSIPERVARASTEEMPRHQNAAGARTPPPAFVRDVFALPGVQILPQDFMFDHEFTIRTWYIRHVHFPRWIVPRFVELDHRWGRWQSEIAGSWRDMILPHEDVQFFTVQPDPDRSYVLRQPLADVIVAQGIEMNRYAGLLTVFHENDQGQRRPFARAISLPDEVGGVDIANAADVAQLCSSHVCNVYHDRNLIPYSLVPAHYMNDGHGFVAYITPRHRTAAASSHSAQGSQAATAVTHPNDPTSATSNHATGHDPDDMDEDPGDDQGFVSDTSVPDSPAQFEQWQGVHVYRLGRPVVHCFVRWGTYNSILHDIARFMQEHLRNLVGIHHIQAVLAGQHEAEESIILQYTTDLPLGSTEQLIILDVEVHFQSLPDGILRAPEVTRRAHRVVPQVTRQYILRLARLANYCLLQGDRCLVFYNGVLWREQDQRVRPIQHGCYLKVTATPPLDAAIPTEVALNFAVTVDEEEAIRTHECTSRPRQQHALSLVQVSSQLQRYEPGEFSLCRTGTDVDVNPLDLHLPSPSPFGVAFLAESAQPWVHQLADHLQGRAFVECTEEGPVGYVTTWYVNHLNFPRCEESRSIRFLLRDVSDWKEQFLDTWKDLMDPSSQLEISLVLPTPPITATESTAAHILVEQQRIHLTHSAGVISVIRQTAMHASVYHVAVSIARLSTLRQVLHKVHIAELCRMHDCRLTYRNLVWQDGMLEDLESAFNLVVIISPPSDTKAGARAPVNDQQLWSPSLAAAMDANLISLPENEEDVAFFQQSQHVGSSP